MSKKERNNKNKRVSKYSGILAKTGLELRDDIFPLTDMQQHAFSIHSDTPKHMILNGFPGTGKTFLAMYFAFLDIIDTNCDINNILIVRPPVSSNDQGFLPGTAEEKMEPYISAYIDICNVLFGRGDAYGVLKKHGILNVEATSFLRSRTFDQTAVIFDEMQNANFQECDTFITRTGEDSRVYLAGDYYQSDLKGREKGGILDFLHIVQNMNCFETIQFEVDDCVRSGLVLEYLKEKMRRHSETFRNAEKEKMRLVKDQQVA